MMLVVKDLRVRQVVSCQRHSENPRKLPNLAKNELLSKMNLMFPHLLFPIHWTLSGLLYIWQQVKILEKILFCVAQHVF